MGTPTATPPAKRHLPADGPIVLVRQSASISPLPLSQEVYACPLSSSCILFWDLPVQGPKVLHFIMFDKNRSKQRKQLLGQQPDQPQVLRKAADFFPGSSKPASSSSTSSSNSAGSQSDADGEPPKRR